MRPAISIGSFHLPSYAVLVVAGTLVCTILSCKFGRTDIISLKSMFQMLSSAFPWSVLGATCLSIVTRIPFWISGDIALAELLGQGGIVFYGGLLGTVWGIWIESRLKRLAFSTFLDALAPIIPIFHAFGRIGCFLAGCCYGIQWNRPLGILYPVNDVWTLRFPVQIVEAAINLLIGIGLFISSRRGGKSLFHKYLVCYGTTRFFLEFLRGDEIRGIWLGLSTSQWISILILVTVFAIKIRDNRHKRGGKNHDGFGENSGSYSDQ